MKKHLLYAPQICYPSSIHLHVHIQIHRYPLAQRHVLVSGQSFLRHVVVPHAGTATPTPSLEMLTRNGHPASSSKSTQSANYNTLVAITQLVARLLSIILLRKRQQRNSRCRNEMKSRDRDRDRKSYGAKIATERATDPCHCMT